MTLIISLFKNFPLVSQTKYLTAAASGQSIAVAQKAPAPKPLSLEDMNDYRATYYRSWSDNTVTPSADQIASMEMWNRMTDAPIGGLRGFFRA